MWCFAAVLKRISLKENIMMMLRLYLLFYFCTIIACHCICRYCVRSLNQHVQHMCKYSCYNIGSACRHDKNISIPHSFVCTCWTRRTRRIYLEDLSSKLFALRTAPDKSDMILRLLGLVECSSDSMRTCA